MVFFFYTLSYIITRVNSAQGKISAPNRENALMVALEMACPGGCNDNTHQIPFSSSRTSSWTAVGGEFAQVRFQPAKYDIVEYKYFNGRNMLDKHLRPSLQGYFDSLGLHLCKIHLSATQTTVCALLSGFASALSIVLGFPVLAVALLWLSGLFDVLDGTIARLTNTSHPFGAYCDLIADRMVESALILAFAWRYPEHYMIYLLFLVALLFHFSTFVVAGVVFKNSGPKSMHDEKSIVERAEAFIVFSFMILYPDALFPLLMSFTLIVLISGCTRFKRVKDSCNL